MEIADEKYANKIMRMWWAMVKGQMQLNATAMEIVAHDKKIDPVENDNSNGKGKGNNWTQ